MSFAAVLVLLLLYFVSLHSYYTLVLMKVNNKLRIYISSSLLYRFFWLYKFS